MNPVANANKKVAVVIPVYMEYLREEERISLMQCAGILGNYPLILLTPSNLEQTEAERFLFEQTGRDIEKKCFAPEHFKGIKAYNQLMLSAAFYKAFQEYEYILIYQTDALVFKDELETWCAKAYDYIGAPWFRSFWKRTSKTQLWKSGNGGFSLRKVDAFLRVLEHKGKFTSNTSFFAIFNSPLLKLKKLSWGQFRQLKLENTVDFFRAINQTTEDRFWAIDVKNSYLNFKVAENKEALQFAFECNPRQMYRLNGEQLPFGCHAWLKYDKAFWDETYFCQIDK